MGEIQILSQGPGDVTSIEETAILARLGDTTAENPALPVSAPTIDQTVKSTSAETLSASSGVEGGSLAGSACTVSDSGTGNTAELHPNDGITFNANQITTDQIAGLAAATGMAVDNPPVLDGDVRNINARTPVPYYISMHYNQSANWTRKTGDNSVVQSPEEMEIDIGGVSLLLTAQVEIDVDVAGDWDTTEGTNYSTAANRAGLDFYVYAVQPGSGTEPEFVLSANSTVPTGYTADNSRKVAGFHCLCVAAGTISGHTLTGYLQGDILPASVWDLRHRAHGLQEGTAYDASDGYWHFVYLASGTGANTRSAYGATITDTRDWMDFSDDLAAVGHYLPRDRQFQTAAGGSNEKTNISGSADPVTTGGHSDTAGRRMISNIGLEDCCGAIWQWLDEQSYQFAGAANHTHQVVASGDPETITSGNPSGDVAPAWAYYALPGNKGSINKQGTYGDVKLLAGNHWSGGTGSGSRARAAFRYRWTTDSTISARGCSPSRHT